MDLNLNDSISISTYYTHPLCFGPSLDRNIAVDLLGGVLVMSASSGERVSSEPLKGVAGRRWGGLVAERCRETRKRSLHGSRISDPVKDRRQRQAGGTTAWSWRWPSQNVSQRPRGSDRTAGVTVTVAATASRKKLPLESRRIGWRSPNAGHEIEVP